MEWGCWMLELEDLSLEMKKAPDSVLVEVSDDEGINVGLRGMDTLDAMYLLTFAVHALESTLSEEESEEFNSWLDEDE